MIGAIYRIIYSRRINYILRNFLRFLKPLVPESIRIPPSGVMRVKLENGRLLRLMTNPTSYLTKYIFWEGGYKKFEYAAIFSGLIKKVDTFWDIGANIGFYSLIAAMQNRNIVVTSFEPASGPLFYLEENVRLNSLRNIRVEPLALSDIDGEIEFYEVSNRKYSFFKHNLSGESNTGSKSAEKLNLKKQKVVSSTIDSYLKKSGTTSIELIKIDTEGSEHLILNGAQSLLSDSRPIIICETLFNTIEADLEHLMIKKGYHFYNHLPQGLKRVETIIRSTDDGVRNCFFVPPEKLHLIEEYVAG